MEGGLSTIAHFGLPTFAGTASVRSFVDEACPRSHRISPSEFALLPGGFPGRDVGRIHRRSIGYRSGAVEALPARRPCAGTHPEKPLHRRPTELRSPAPV